MPRTMTRPPAAPTNRRAVPLYLIAGVVCVAVLLPVARQLQDAPRVDLTITNDTSWDVGVDLVTDDDAVRPVATLRRGTTRTIGDVLVPGDTWRIRWMVQGREMHVSVIGHDELRRAGFAIAVPEQVAAAAADAAGIKR